MNQVGINTSWNKHAYDYYQPTLPAHVGNQDKLAELASDNVWVIVERYPAQEIPSSSSEAWLDANLQLVETIPFYRLEVRHYQN